MAEKHPFWPVFGAKRSPKSLIFFFRNLDILFLRLPLLRKIKVSLLERKNEILIGTPLLSPPPKYETNWFGLIRVRNMILWPD